MLKNNLKYLGEIIKERNIEIVGNTLIISPVGSGKTYYILNDLCKNKKALYLCDTTNLKQQVLKEDGTTDWEEQKIEANIDVMTYQKFGAEIKFNNGVLIDKYDIVIADEVHNLIDYQRFDDTNNLERATEYLLKKYEHTQILFFTATPKYLDIMTYKYSNFDRHFNMTLDFSNDKEIMQYFNRRLAYINHYTDVEKQLVEYKGYFKQGCKALIFTNTIENMRNLEDICWNLKLKPISIWSIHSEQRLSYEQNRIRQELIDDGVLSEEYNVLIINRSLETGVNIYDDRMQLMICNTSNEVQQIQARGRIRNDIDLLVLKTKDLTKVNFSIDEDFLDKWWTKGVIEEFVIGKNNMRDTHGRIIGMRALPNELEKYGYQIENKRRRLEGKLCTIYKITKK